MYIFVTLVDVLVVFSAVDKRVLKGKARTIVSCCLLRNESVLNCLMEITP